MVESVQFYAAAIPAVLFLGLGKGGFSGLGILAVPILSLVITPIQSAAIVLPILMVQDVVSVYMYRHTFDRRNLAILIPGAIIGIGLGYLFAAIVSDAALKFALGLLSVVFGLRGFLAERAGNTAPKPARIGPGLVWGMIAGLSSMIANAGGPPFQIYVMPQRLDRDKFVGTASIFFGLINWLKVPPFIALGQFTQDTLMTSFSLFPMAILSTFAGVALVRRVSVDRFYPLIYGFLVVVGAKLGFDGFLGLIVQP
jgi:uncharacterized membrane protein YfcA